VAALVDRLPAGALRLETPVARVAPLAGRTGWRLELGGSRPGVLEVDGLIVATPVRAAAELLGAVDRRLGEVLGAITTAASATVSLALAREQVAHPLDGFGFVVPYREPLGILSGSFSSVKFPGRSPEGQVLLRVFLGGAREPGVVELPDAAIIDRAVAALRPLLGLTGVPRWATVHRWRGVMPQYEVGHLERVEEIEWAAAQFPALGVAGNALRGIGVPQCIQSGERAAEGVLAALGVAVPAGK
jgi:oxygen-dependent protoporphyrinogen oxidase